MRCLLLRVFYSWRDVTRYEIFPYHHFQPFSTVLEGEWQAPSPFKLNDVPSYPTPSQELFPLHPFDFPPLPHPTSVLLLPRVMELNFQIDTSWCMGCSISASRFDTYSTFTATKRSDKAAANVRQKKTAMRGTWGGI